MSHSVKYEALPTDDASTDNLLLVEEEDEGLHAMTVRDPRFNPPPPAAWKRGALLAFIVFLFVFAFWLRGNAQPARSNSHRGEEYEKLYGKYSGPKAGKVPQPGEGPMRADSMPRF